MLCEVRIFRIKKKLNNSTNYNKHAYEKTVMMYFLTFPITSVILHCNVAINTYFTKYRMQFSGVSDFLGVEFQVILCYVNANKPPFTLTKETQYHQFLNFTVSTLWMIGISNARYPDFKEPKRRWLRKIFRSIIKVIFSKHNCNNISVF